MPQRPSWRQKAATNLNLCADELVQLRVNRHFGQPTFRRLGDAKVNDLGYRRAVLERDQDIGRLDVPVNDSLLERVLTLLRR